MSCSHSPRIRHFPVRLFVAHDNAGRPTGIAGSGYAGVPSYASAIGYRAFGAMKQMNYGNGKSLSLQFDNRMRVTSWSVPNIVG